MVAATAGLAQPAGPKTIRVIGLPARPLPITIALSQGWFAERGFTVVTDVALRVQRDLRKCGRAPAVQPGSAVEHRAVRVQQQPFAQPLDDLTGVALSPMIFDGNRSASQVPHHK